MVWKDRSEPAAAPWRLAGRFVRRQPHTTSLLRTHPGGGMYDCLSILPPTTEKGELNRYGTIQSSAIALELPC